jgi:hypothetical protein
VVATFAVSRDGGSLERRHVRLCVAVVSAVPCLGERAQHVPREGARRERARAADAQRTTSVIGSSLLKFRCLETDARGAGCSSRGTYPRAMYQDRLTDGENDTIFAR